MKTIGTALLIALLTVPSFAQDDDDDDKGYTYFSRTKIGGAGGVTPIVGVFDNTEIDRYLTGAGLPALGSDPLYIVGGEGYGYIMFLRNVRMGGFGGTGKRTVSRLDPVGNLKKEVEYQVTYGGFLMDYVQPVAYRLDVAVGATIGSGTIDITMRRDDNSFKDWDSLWTSYGSALSTSKNYTRRLQGSFITFAPHVNVEYTLLTWLQLRVGVGYPMMFSPEWKLDDLYDVNNVPSKIKTSGYTINAGIMFGFFGW
ncbi:MAG: hypothetical protein F9K22_00855 [Bacteroidetes bacterium]|nr:MAG: hypothetical protein F9K22_00855 [Bacteroidota bacterium]